MHELIIATGYKSSEIRSYVNEYYTKSIYKIVNSGDVDIIKRIQESCKYIQKDFMVLYGDTISNINLDNLIKYHQTHLQPVTMCVWPLRSQFGIVDVGKDGKVLGFQEKPILDKWINIGYFYINKNYRDYIFNHNSFEYFLLDAANNKSINAYKHLGLHITVNTLSELEEAQLNIKSIIKDKK